MRISGATIRGRLQADPNIINKYGYNALAYAEKYEYKEIQAILKAHGARSL